MNRYIAGQLSAAIALATIMATPGIAQSPADSKLSVNGFLSQAYARSSGHQVLGIPLEGTSDYREAALQFWYRWTDRDNFVMQIAHERVGDGPIGRTKADMRVDWVFYQRYFGKSTSLRIGKVKAPIGIFNEVRSVGTVLPLYQVPQTFYGDRSYTTQALDGVVVERRQALGRGWSFDASAFYGSWDFLQFDLVTKAQARNAVGGQLWINAPINGLRVGLGGRRITEVGLIELGPGNDTGKEWHASLDGVFERFVVRGEYYVRGFQSGGQRSGYGQLGLNLTSRFSVYGQAEFLDNRLHGEYFGLVGDIDLKPDRDRVIALRYAPSPHVVMKVEHHWYKGLNIEDVPLDFFHDAPLAARYMIFSLSVGF